MQSFSFKSNYDENQNIERIISERNRRLVKQQVAFAIVLVILLILLGWYITRKVIYTEFDGYVQSDYLNYRATDDIYLFEQFKDVGDIVFPGDTLYSYMMLSNILSVEDLNSEPSAVVSDRNIRLQSGIAYTEINVLRVRIRELEKQIATEDHNIRFGLTDNSHKMDLQRQLAEAQEQLKSLYSKVQVYNSIRSETNAAIARFGLQDILSEQADLEMFRLVYSQYPDAIRYGVVRDTAVVTKLWSPPFSRVFKKEQIIQLENLNLDNSNMSVVAYVPTGDMGKVNNHTQAQIIVNDDVSFTASVQLLGARTEDLPEELRNSLSHNYTAIMVVFRPDSNQVIPLWAVTDRVPVKVRIKNYDNGKRGDGSDYWYVNNHGLTRDSKEQLGLLPKRRTQRTSIPQPGQPQTQPAAQSGPAAAPQTQPQAADTPDAGQDARQDAGQDAGQDASRDADREQPRPTAQALPQEQEYVYHTIEKHETLYTIAVQYDTTIEEIIGHNPGIKPKKLYVGNKIRIPATRKQEEARS